MIRKYIYGPGIDNPVAMVRRISTTDNGYYYYTDALGSVRLMTNASGTPVESYTYDTYGQPRVMTGAGADNNWLTEDVPTQDYSSIGNRFLFTGREWDSTTKLYYYRFRDYSPTLGRFLQPDPLGYVDGMNLYAYVNNNPLNWIDPWGLFRWYGFYGGPDWSCGVAFPYTNPNNGNRYNTVDDVPDNEWNTMQQNNSPKDCRDEAYRQHDNSYRDAGVRYGRDSREFKRLARAADRRLARDLWHTGRTKNPLKDLQNGITVGVFKIKAGLGI